MNPPLRMLALFSVACLAPAGWCQPPAPAQPAAPKADQPTTTPPATTAKEAAKGSDKDDPKPVVTDHEVVINGQRIAYRVTAALTPLMDDKLKTKARVFCVAYERLSDAKDAEGRAATLASQDPAKRPLTFAFNGGPGSSSVWLHLGALGPRRVVMGPEGELTPDLALADNASSWLDFTDMVFIDPVSTGYSRPVEGEDAKQFHGLDEDIRWVAEFIRLHLVRSQRWLSPKYLVGESYGTTRAAGLSNDLQGRLGIYLSGIVLISPVLNFQTIAFDVGNDSPYWLYLPSYAATAVFHKKVTLPPGVALPEFLAEVSQFAETDYLTALAQGDVLAADRREQIARKIAGYIGVAPAFVSRYNLRVPMGAFTKELLRDRERTAGRLDSRYTGIDRTEGGERPEYDPSYAAIQGPFTAALNAYVRSELKFESDLNYEILTGNVSPWSYASNANRYVNVAESLRRAITANPNLRVWTACGYYDLATPFFAAVYTMRNLQLHESLRPNLRLTFYPSGHMVYIRQADLKRLRDDAAAWYAPSK